MSITEKKIRHLIALSNWSFENARDRQEIQDKIKIHGYDTVRMDSLLEFNAQMETKYREQQATRANQKIASKNFTVAFLNEKKQCKNLRRFVRSIIQEEENNKYERLLGLDERLKSTYEGFFEQAQKLYVHIQQNAELLGRLSKFKKTAETFQARLTALDELKKLYKIYESAIALSQVATQDRDNLFLAFSKEWSDFKDTCQMAYEDEENPQYQELVGIKVYSPGYSPTSDTEPTEPPIPSTPSTPSTPPTSPTPSVQSVTTTLPAPPVPVIPGAAVENPVEKIMPVTPEQALKN